MGEKIRVQLLIYQRVIILSFQYSSRPSIFDAYSSSLVLKPKLDGSIRTKSSANHGVITVEWQRSPQFWHMNLQFDDCQFYHSTPIIYAWYL